MNHAAPAREIEQRGGHVYIQYHLVANCDGLHRSREVHDEGDADGFLIGKALVPLPMFPEEISVVACKDKDRILELIHFA
jgi:hypothetical protein